MKATNILYLSYDGLTDQLGQSQILPYIIGLSNRGYRFTVISFEKENGLYSRDSIQEIMDSHTISWKPLTYTKSPPVLSTFYDFIRLKKLAFSLIRSKDIKLVHCRSYITSLVGLSAKRKLKTKFLFDMRGLWADERVDGELWNLKNPIFNSIFNYFKKKELEFLTEADCTISLTQAGKTEINSWFKKTENPRIEIIPCAVDNEIFSTKNTSADEIKSINEDLKLEGKKVLIYLGSLGTWYMLDEMLSYFKELNTNKDWMFLFLTRESDVLKNALKQKGISESEVRIVAAQRNQVPNYLTLCTAGIFFIKPSYSKISSSPTKQAELMSMGIPVIVNDKVGDTSSIVRKYNSGVVINTFNSTAYKKAANDFNVFDFDSEKIRNGAIDYFGLDKAVDTYFSVYKEILH